MTTAGPLPNLIVGGAQKSGTTGLHTILDTHDDIFFPGPPAPQEIHFFDLDRNYRRGMAWYRSFFESWSGQRWIGQTSPLYLYDARVPERIGASLPDVRFLFILRNPVDRAYSHYWHEIRYGWETETFENALRREEERIRRSYDYRRHFSYLDRGRYATQLRRFEAVFGRDRIHVLATEDLRRNPQRVLEAIAKFLGGINVGGFDHAVAGTIHNASMLPRWRFLQRLTRVPRELVPHIGTLVDRINLVSSRYPRMNPDLRNTLRIAFTSEVEELSANWGVDVSLWDEADGNPEVADQNARIV